MAMESGIQIPDTYLFPANSGPVYYAVKRFDVDRTMRYPMQSACGMLHADLRRPSLDYEDLLVLTFPLTHDIREMEKMFRLVVFNVLAYNRNDHSKNFSFLLDSFGQWKFLPAYDTTFSAGCGGEQSHMVMGEGRNPDVENLMRLGIDAKISIPLIAEIIDQTKSAIMK